MKSSGMVRFISLVLVLFFLVYAGWQTYRFFFAGYKTETAVGFEVARAVNTQGILIRSEQSIEKNISGVVHYTVSEGQKFVSNTPLAIVYNSKEDVAQADKYDKLQTEKALLELVQRSTDVGQIQDVELLSRDLSVALNELTKSADYADFGAVDKLRLTITEKFARRQLVTGELDSFTERIDELTGQMPQMPAGDKIYSSHVGYFSRYVDGCEAQFTPEMLKNLDSQTLTQLASQEYTTREDAFGKCIIDFKWYYATVIPEENISLFNPGSAVTLTFIGGSSEPVSGTIYSVTEEKDNNCAVVVIESEELSPDAVSRRSAAVKVSFDNYKGVRFSKKALRIVDGNKGVYIKSGYTIRYRLVEIVFTGKDYYLSRMEYNSESYLNMFDEVIVEGIDLYDGKPLQ